jgi:hypothetical protein
MDLELYLDMGTYDINFLIPLVRNFVQILLNKNYVHQYNEWHEGHSWGNWKGHLSFALKQFFAPGTGINVNPVQEKMNLYQNSPNPFKISTRIDFTVPVGTNVELTIYDTSGKRIQTLCNQVLFTESNSILFKNTDLASGIYFYSLRVNNFLLSRKMNISN